MPGERDMSRIIRQMLHKKQERTQTIESEEPRIDDLKEGIPEFRNVRDRGIVQYVKYRDDIYSIVMEKEGLADGINEGAPDIIGNVDRSFADQISTVAHGVCSDTSYKTEWSCELAGETWTEKAIGWDSLSSGLIIQWGEGSFDTDSAFTVTFPKVFNGECFGVFVNHKISGNSSVGTKYGYPITAYSYSTTGFVMNRHDTASDTINYNYIAIGH